MKKLILATLLVVSGSALSIPNPPNGDWKGKVGAVTINHTEGRAESFRIYFSTSTIDRANCLGSHGYVTVEQSSSVSTIQYSLIYAMAIQAAKEGRELSLWGGVTDQRSCVGGGKVTGSQIHTPNA